jgi:hypothetical protein
MAREWAQPPEPVEYEIKPDRAVGASRMLWVVKKPGVTGSDV